MALMIPATCNWRGSSPSNFNLSTGARRALPAAPFSLVRTARRRPGERQWKVEGMRAGEAGHSTGDDRCVGGGDVRANGCCAGWAAGEGAAAGAAGQGCGGRGGLARDLKTHPSDPEPYAHLGLLEARQEHYKAGRSRLSAGFGDRPCLPALRLNLGLALFKAGEMKDALRNSNRF